MSLLNELRFYGTTLNVPEGGYRSLLLGAAQEIDRLQALQAPVTCLHCKQQIDRAGDWYRCADCDGHYHKGCLTAHARDWRPSHPPSAGATK